MAVCAFFGPEDFSAPNRNQLRRFIEDLIVNRKADTFYVGNEGLFDALVHFVLLELKKTHPQIHYSVVLSQKPSARLSPEELTEVLVPDGLIGLSPAQSIAWRDCWMKDQADMIVLYDRELIVIG